MGMVSEFFILGVDGGGTGCRVALCDRRGRRLATVDGGPANYTTYAQETLQNILDAVQKTASKADLTHQDLEKCVAHVGLAGVMGEEDCDAIATAMPFGNVTVSDDRETSVAGALGDRDGVLAAVGTGTIVAARKNGAVQCFGGWGSHLADQGSGGWLGRKALRRTMLAFDGLAEHSVLTEGVLERFSGNPFEAVKFAASALPGNFATFAPNVVEAACQGDVTAIELMQEGAEYLQSCFRASNLGDNTVVCLAGGVGPHYEPYLKGKFRSRMQPPSGTALDGALRLAKIASQRMERQP